LKLGTGDVIGTCIIRVVWDNLFGEALSVKENTGITFQYLDLSSYIGGWNMLDWLQI